MAIQDPGRTRAEVMQHGILLNTPDALSKAAHLRVWRPVPSLCDHCNSEHVYTNANMVRRKQNKAWMTYNCRHCGSQTLCAKGTDIPLGLMVTQHTIQLRGSIMKMMKQVIQPPYNADTKDVRAVLETAAGRKDVDIMQCTFEECKKIEDIFSLYMKQFNV